ncbi:MAG TPA: alpha/beta fold hydrolase [Roseiarcus sp.]|nr:alpha/beta fold hydrolase [Roseiarcus sp.]
MSFPFKDPLFAAQWLRAAGHASAGGADLGECLAAARAIRELDVESWRSAWSSLADGLARKAMASLAAGHSESAHAALLRASNYYRTAYVFMIGPGPDPRLMDAYRRQSETFAQALAARPGLGEPIVIPFEGKTIRGYFFSAPRGGPRPTLVLTGGYDSTAEEAYFYSGPAALARGYNVVCYDGPGQGGTLIEDGMTFRPDWETVLAAVLGYLMSRAEVDPARVAQLGLSFGGYLAPRAASGNPMLAACIADPGQYSLLEEAKTRLPGLLARQLPDGSPFLLDALDKLIRLRLEHPTKGWAIRRGLWTHGLERPIDYLRLTAQYTLDGRAQLIACPTLVCSAEDDQIGASGAKLYEQLTCPKRFERFKSRDGAGAHCESGARGLFNQIAFDWLDEVLAIEKAPNRRAA